MDNANVELPWYEVGVFQFLQMSPEVIEEFTIDQNASSVVRQERKSLWAQQYVNENCKTCGWKSRVHYGNPSNWVRHLKSVSSISYIFLRDGITNT